MFEVDSKFNFFTEANFDLHKNGCFNSLDYRLL
nr:MAG TPA: hypothetical protein [Bacteriophage sp.]